MSFPEWWDYDDDSDWSRDESMGPQDPIIVRSGRAERSRTNRELKRQGLEDASVHDRESGMKRRRARRKGLRHERVRKDRRSRERDRENSFSPDE